MKMFATPKSRKIPKNVPEVIKASKRQETRSKANTTFQEMSDLESK